MSTIRAESKITGVTVFESSAQVRRETTIDKMPKGEVNIVFADLPQNLDRDNVQVAVRFEQEEQKKQDAATDKAASCSLRGVSFKTETVTVEERKDSSAEREALQKELKELNLQFSVLQDKLSDTQAEKSFFRDCLDSALASGRSEEEADPVFADISHWKKMLETTHSSDKETLIVARQLEKQSKELSEKIDLVRRNLNALGGGNITTTKNVVIVSLLASRELFNVDVRISYVVNSASWSAEYDVRYDPEKSEANVTYNAVVSQTGSEVWPNVILTISTARPTISGKPVELSPWRTSIYVPPQIHHYARESRRSLAKQSAPMMACAAPMRMAEEKEDCLDDVEAVNDIGSRLAALVAPTIQTAAVKEGATSMTFCLENHPYTVLNTGKSVRVTLAIVPVKSSVSYITRPKLTETVFAQMKAVNLSNFTLLPGPALVFCGQQFISKTTLSRCSPTDEFTVNLGADNDVVVKYRRLKNERTDVSGGLMSSGKVKYNVQTKIVVKNRKRDVIDIVVEDQIPISQHSDIEVTLVQPPPPAEHEEERKSQLREGLVKFSLKIPAQKEEEIPIEFTVKHPKNFEMSGL